jgi:hypothetical protein
VGFFWMVSKVLEGIHVHLHSSHVSRIAKVDTGLSSSLIGSILEVDDAL